MTENRCLWGLPVLKNDHDKLLFECEVKDLQWLLKKEFIGHLLNCNSSIHEQVYRLHQLNRAAQLVTALSFSVKGAETTPQTLAINSSLGTLFHVLQFLGVICIWSLSSFLMRLFPSSAVAPDP